MDIARDAVKIIKNPIKVTFENVKFEVTVDVPKNQQKNG